MRDPHHVHFTEPTIDSIADRYLAASEREQKESESFGQCYTVSKVLATAYFRDLAKEVGRRSDGGKVYGNSMQPGVVQTDMNSTAYGPASRVEAGADTAVWLVLLPKGGPSGKFFYVDRSTASMAYRRNCDRLA